MTQGDVLEDAMDGDSDSTSCSSSSDDAPDDEEKCMSQSRFQNQLEKFYYKDHCVIYKHDRTRKLALKSVGSETGTFPCGRSI